MGTPRWNIHAMRMGPGKHLHGLVLPGGVKGEEFDYFVSLLSGARVKRSGLELNSFCYGSSMNWSSCKNW